LGQHCSDVCIKVPEEEDMASFSAIVVNVSAESVKRSREFCGSM
jgi:hypothetical protein